MMDEVLPSSNLMEPCSAWGRNVVSVPVSGIAYYSIGSASYAYLQRSSDCETRLLVA